MLPHVVAQEEEEVIEPAPRASWDRKKLIALLILTLIAGILRFVNLSDPPELVFDETYYAKDACWYVHGTEEKCYVSDEVTAVHPPLGKWLISLGVGQGDYTCVEEDEALCKEPGAHFTDASAFAWRVVPAIAGSITVALLFALALKLFSSLWAAAGAALLLALDPLHFVQSRVAMLDVFLPMFGLAMVLCLLADRDRTDREDLLWRPWLLAAGVLAGAALASKWSGAFFIALAIALTAAWAVGQRRAEGSDMGEAILKALQRDALPLFLWLVLMPIFVYLLTYVGRLDGRLIAWGEGSWIQAFWDRQNYMLDFHRELKATHTYQSPPWSWIAIRRPVSYFFCSGGDCAPGAPEGDYQEIFATGSPLVWWTSLVAMICVAIAWVRRRDFHRPEGLILAGFVFTYGPWLVPMERSAVFIFYLLPAVPFMCLAIVWVATKLGESWEAKAARVVFAASVIGMFAWYYPLLAKVSIPEPAWRARIWIFDNCDKPPGETTTTQVTVTENGKPKVTTSETTTGGDEPPEGWCWI